MLAVRKTFRGAWKRNHAAGLFSGATKEERKEERARRKQEVYVDRFLCGNSSSTRLHACTRTGGMR